MLVTGGAGYIGSILVPALLDRGYEVAVVDNFMYGQDGLAAVCHDEKFSLTRGDVRSMDVMRPLLRKADVVIPLAAIVGAPRCDRDPAAATSTNLTAIADMAGLDVYQAAFRILEEAYGERFATPAALTDLVASGRLGTKSGGGFYDRTPEETAEQIRRREPIAA